MPASVSLKFGGPGDEAVVEDSKYNEYHGVWDCTDFKAFYSDVTTPDADVYLLCYDDVNGQRVNPRGVKITYLDTMPDFTEAVDEFNGSFCFSDLYANIDLHYFPGADGASTDAVEWFVLRSRNVPRVITRRVSFIGDSVTFNGKFVEDANGRVLFGVYPIEYTDVAARQEIIDVDATGFTIRTTFYTEATDVYEWTAMFGEQEGRQKLLDFLSPEWEGSGVYLVDAAIRSGNYIYTGDRTNLADVQADVGDTWMTRVGDVYTCTVTIFGIVHGKTTGSGNSDGVTFTISSGQTLSTTRVGVNDHDVTFTAGTGAFIVNGGTINSTGGGSIYFYIGGGVTTASNYFSATGMTMTQAANPALSVITAGRVCTLTNCNITANAVGNSLFIYGTTTGTFTMIGGSFSGSNLMPIPGNSHTGTTIIRDVDFSACTNAFNGVTNGATGGYTLYVENCILPALATVTTKRFYFGGTCTVYLRNNTVVGNGPPCEMDFLGAGTTGLNKTYIGCYTTPTITASGSPLSGATVTIYNPDGSELFSGTTNASGQIDNSGVAYVKIDYILWDATAFFNRGAYYMTVSKTGYSTREEIKVNTANANATQTIALSTAVVANNTFRFDGVTF